MAIWLELRCDARLPGCHSNRNDGPMSLAMSSRTALYTAVQRLEIEALHAGWKRYRVFSQLSWKCPTCSKEAL